MIKSSRSKRRKLKEELQLNDCFIHNNVNSSNNVQPTAPKFINDVKDLSNCDITILVVQIIFIQQVHNLPLMLKI